MNQLARFFSLLLISSGVLFALTAHAPMLQRMQKGHKDDLVDFTLKDTSGKDVAISSFRGKLVVISMGADWCRACMDEVEPTKELENYFLGRDIVWVFVSFDRDEKSWNEARKRDRLPGIHLYGKPKSNELKTMFEFSSIPYFIWIDKEGHLLQSDAPRPSSKSSKKQLKLYLE